jgi:hypothetical protein
VTLSDGQRLTGRVVSRSLDSVTLVLEDGSMLILPTAAVRGVEAFEPSTVSGAWGPDPNRSRYLYAPAAFTLGQGNGYVAQRAIVITSVGIGLLDGLDLEGGTVLPTLFSKTAIGVAGLKAAMPITETLRAGLGAQAFFIGDIAAGFFFANSTVGTPDAHVTLAGGGAIEWSKPELLATVMTLAGSLRLSSGVALVSENWFLVFHDRESPWGGAFFAVPSAGVRLFGSTFAVDLALVPIVTGTSDFPFLPLPWLSFAWNFGLAGHNAAQD